jgi:hypothetical protein
LAQHSSLTGNTSNGNIVSDLCSDSCNYLACAIQTEIHPRLTPSYDVQHEIIFESCPPFENQTRVCLRRLICRVSSSSSQFSPSCARASKFDHCYLCIWNRLWKLTRNFA